MIDDLLRPIGPGPRPPTDGFVQALYAGRQRRWRTVRNHAAAATAAVAVVVAALMPRLAPTSFVGLEPTTPVIGTRPAPAPTSAAPEPSATPSPSLDDAPDRGAPVGSAGGGTSGPAGHATAGYAPAASGGPAGPRSYGTAEPVEPDGQAGPDGGGGSTPPPSPYDPPASDPPAPEPTPPPPQDTGPEPVDLSYEDQSVNAPCQGSAWCWSAHVTGTYTFRLKACRGASDTQGILRFSTENEADFAVVQGGVEVWRWSDGQPDHQYVHDVFVDRWRCAVWSTRWSGDSPGAYRLDAVSRATNVPARTWSASFSVT